MAASSTKPFVECAVSCGRTGMHSFRRLWTFLLSFHIVACFSSCACILCTHLHCCIFLFPRLAFASCISKFHRAMPQCEHFVSGIIAMADVQCGHPFLSLSCAGYS